MANTLKPRLWHVIALNRESGKMDWQEYECKTAERAAELFGIAYRDYDMFILAVVKARAGDEPAPIDATTREMYQQALSKRTPTTSSRVLLERKTAKGV